MKRGWKIVNIRSFYSSIWFLMRNNTTHDGTSLYHNKKSDLLYNQSSPSRRLAFRPLIQLCRCFNFTICCNHKLVLSKITAGCPTRAKLELLSRKFFIYHANIGIKVMHIVHFQLHSKLHPTCINEQPVVISFWKWKNGTRDYCWK